MWTVFFFIPHSALPVIWGCPNIKHAGAGQHILLFANERFSGDIYSGFKFLIIFCMLVQKRIEHVSLINWFHYN